MRRLLQSIIYNRKLYDRPQDEWVCGRAAEGCPCIFGPGAKGECRATSQCLPAKKGDRWVCTRAISLGGACAAGPMPDGSCGCPVPPCWPQRSLRARRGRLTWLTTCFALGLVVLALWGRGRLDWSNPGPLTSQHALSAQRCTDCHLESGSLALSGAARAGRQLAHDQLCLKCHDLGPQATSPHGATGAQLAALARGDKPGGNRPLALAAVHTLLPAGPGSLACASCHQEHKGRDFNLKLMTDRQCQVCHQAQFASFGAGHPEFKDYPYARRTRLRFDHTAHWQQYFPDARLAGTKTPTSCLTCHEPAMDGRQMLVQNFEQTCAACHAGQIDGKDRAGVKGLAFLRLPGFDRAALEAAGEGIGEWPAGSSGGLTPFMRRLLEADDSARAALQDLGPANITDLSKATPAQKAAAGRLLWSVKGLLADLVAQGQPAILRRLGPPPAGAAGGRTGQFSADALLAAQQAWLPNLPGEVAAYRRGEKPGAAAAVPQPGRPAPGAPPALEFDEADARVAEGGWYRRDQNYTLYYRPAGHADRFLTAWIDATANEATPAGQAIFNQLAAESAPGVCMKCHTVDQAGDRRIVNWDTAQPQPDRRPFTTFKHTAHFSHMGEQGCATCHTLDATADHARGFGLNRDPAVFQSNFVPMNKDTCAACHQSTKAGDSCQQCHNYHTGDLKMLTVPPGGPSAAAGLVEAKLLRLVAKNTRP